MYRQGIVGWTSKPRAGFFWEAQPRWNNGRRLISGLERGERWIIFKFFDREFWLGQTIFANLNAG